jgi:sterol desaturase/sphingolipid hydroxylase (fatty acid hydroxylase superfamily)
MTVLATPVYFGAMALENKALERRDAAHPTAADYAKPDTVASLTMGVASTVVPLAAYGIQRLIGKKAQRVAVGMALLTGASAVVTTIADRAIRRARRDRRDTARATQVAAAGAVATVAIGGSLLTMGSSMLLTPERIWERGKHRDLGDGLVPWTLAMVGWDLAYYWNHRFMHTFRYMWAIHVVHHSSEHYNLSTALRQPVASMFGVWVPYGLVCRLGVRPKLVAMSRDINLLYQFWIHTDLVRRLGPGEAVLNTPSHHRAHHGSNRRYIDRNHGGILIVWDRLFGTFAREDDSEPVVYGLTKNIETYRPWRIATHEYRDMFRDVAASDNWSDRLSFVVRGPGWAYRRRAELDETMSAAG